MLYFSGAHCCGLTCDHRGTLYGLARTQPAHDPAGGSCQRRKISKQPRTDQSAKILSIDGAINKLGYQKLLHKLEVKHVMHSFARSFPHQRHMPVVLKSSL